MGDKSKRPSPSRFAEWVLKHVFPDNGLYTPAGDFEEVFREIAHKRGTTTARLWYWLQIVLSLRPFVSGKIYWSAVMIKNYLKMGLRRFNRHKGYTFINMFGLTVGIACCLVIFLYVSDEMSYDKYHNDLDRIYRVGVRDDSSTATGEGSAQVCAPVARVLKENFAQVEVVAQAFKVRGGLTEKGEKKFYEDTRIFADTELFQILTIPFLQGDAHTSLERPYTIVLTEQMANKYFGKQDALGQTISINSRDYEITGIVADPPHNTHFKYDYFISMKTLEGRYPFDAWLLSNFYIYVKLKPNQDIADITARMERIGETHIPKEMITPGDKIIYFLQPVADIHLFSHLRNEPEPCMNPFYLYVFSAIGLFVLLIACMNFINLSTARSTKRAKEVGIRKVIGAKRTQLVRQFFGESSVLIFIALMFALFLVSGILPLVNSISGKSFATSDLLHPSILMLMFILVIFVGFIASAYPSLFLSSFQPVKALRANFQSGSKGASLRKLLVISQFAISIALIAGTLIVYRQINFMKTQYLGFDSEQKLIIPVRGTLSIEENYEAVKESFMQHASITGATVSSDVPGQSLDRWDTKTVGGGEELSRVLNHTYVGPDFLNEYEITLVAGRFFDKKISTDANETFVLNRMAVEEYGWTPEEALGKRLEGIFPATVIGVIEDFHHLGLQTTIEPLALAWRPPMFAFITLNTTTESLPNTIAFAKRQWEDLFPGFPFDYYFLDSYFDRQYQSEERVGKMFSIFTVLGVIIACLGLFGLASFTAEQKTKEIGIRKVLGATIPEILIMLSKEFIKWVLIANLIAWPVVYLAMSSWLENFAYRINVKLEILIASALLAAAIAFITISYQSVKASLANPVDALRYE
jgi:putative ABC transport system permease protein